jgi:hypothetical protein
LQTLTVGIGSQYNYHTVGAAVSAAYAAGAAGVGDIIAIAPGTYDSTAFGYSLIGQSVTIQPMGWSSKNPAPTVHLEQTTVPPNDKGMFTVGLPGMFPGNAPNVTINGIEISGVAIPAKLGDNGAAIRWQSGNLTLNDDYFHNNQEGLLGTPAKSGAGNLVINQSEFAANGSNGSTHGLYVNQIASLTITDSFFHDTIKGHEIKSRAEVNKIIGNRIFTGSGTDSNQIDLPQGGTDTVSMNIMEKGLGSQNPRFIGFGEAQALGVGQDWATSSLSVTGNTFINEKPGAVGVWNDSGFTNVSVTDNTFRNLPTASTLSGHGTTSGNVYQTGTPSTLDYKHPWNDV